MAVEIHIKHGDEAAEKKDLLTAISHYSAALKESPDAYLALVKRAAVYTKLSSYAEAKSDITKAFVIAERRGKRSDKATCHYRLALVNYAEKDYDGAVVNFKKAQEYQCAEPGLGIWLAKAERELKKTGNTVETVVTAKVDQEPQQKSTLVDTINKNAPLKVKIRDDWYQNNDTVTITIYAKNIDESTLSVDFATRSVSVSFPSADNSEYNYDLEPLFGTIDTEKSTFKVYSTKLEITLYKAQSGKWAKLEGDGTTDSAPVQEQSSGGLAYPSSAKKAINWSSFQVQEEEDKGGDDFFAKLYKDVDDDTRRAMMKSYVESNGTVLTTNWAEAKDKTFETSPPDGMEAHKWER
ncbi:CIC11C00000005599 [Sungouiella intermedia]|uniref:CIC11C00000005599 n=1 Tax=Sungouiella intermedia TaxID=45354 RepID=A0A1L0BRL3_9ASCO|nr:CIC11C00000005599 [[Candida] intermedia]